MVRQEFDWRAIDPYGQDAATWAQVDPTLVISVIRGWIDQGWNVGIFHWTQLADDDGTVYEPAGLPLPFNAQIKIWNASYPGVGMRWRRCQPDGTVAFETRPEQQPQQPVKDLFYAAYVQALSQYSGPEIRIAGTSLGAQLTVALAQMTYEGTTALSAGLQPKRLALIDPYWSPPDPLLSHNGQPYYSFMPGGKVPGELIRDYVQALKQRNVIFEWSTTSGANAFNRGDVNTPLQPLISNTSVELAYFDDGTPLPLDFGRRHGDSYRYYFRSQELAPPDECTWNSGQDVGGGVCYRTGRVALSAATSNERTRAIMDAGGRWEQVTGWNTPSLADDTFRCTDQEACRTRTLLIGSSESLQSLAAQGLKAWLPDTDFRVVELTREPTAADLAETALLIVFLPAPPSAAVRERVRQFVEQDGGAVLIVGEHTKYTPGAGAGAYAAIFGMAFGTDNVFPDCDADHRALLAEPGLFGLSATDSAQVAGSNTVMGGAAYLRTSDGKVILAGKQYPGLGRVVVAGDANIWGGCGYSENRDVHTALVNWLRVSPWK